MIGDLQFGPDCTLAYFERDFIVIATVMYVTSLQLSFTHKYHNNIVLGYFFIHKTDLTLLGI